VYFYDVANGLIRTVSASGVLNGTAFAAATFVDNFTIAFWARAREALNFSELPSTAGFTLEPRGSLFMPLSLVTNVTVAAVGFYLGVDGFSVQFWSMYNVGSLVQRQPLIGWHHYAIVFNNRQPSVFIDGNSRDSAVNRAPVPYAEMLFRPIFGRTRFRYLMPYGFRVGTGFEGWISELRLANRTMSGGGGEAFAQMNNLSAWTSSYSMNGCSGENHTGTDVERFDLQQSWLVCGEPLPTCGADGGGGGFQIGEPAGCLCERADLTRACIGGEWAVNNAVLARPLARWRLNQNSSTVLDASGNGFDGQIIGVPGVDYEFQSVNGSNFTTFTGKAAFIEFGDLGGIQFGLRDFAVEATIRYSSTSLADSVIAFFGRDCYSSYWAFYLINGILGFQVGNSRFYPNGVDGDFQRIGSPSSLADNKWHRVQALRLDGSCYMLVDNNPVALAMDCSYDIAPGGSLLVGAQYCALREYSTIEYFVGDMIDVSVNVDTLPGQQLCNLSSIGYNSGSFPDIHSCSRIAGFCNTANVSRQCCATSGCLACSAYHSCDVNDTIANAATTITTNLTSSVVSSTTYNATARTSTNNVNANASSSTTEPMALTKSVVAVTMIASGGSRRLFGLF
jgi:hypothetical protein